MVALWQLHLIFPNSLLISLIIIMLQKIMDLNKKNLLIFNFFNDLFYLRGFLWVELT